MDIIKTLEFEDYIIKIHRPVDYDNPQEDINNGNVKPQDACVFIVYDHKQFNVEVEGFVPREIFKALENDVSEHPKYDGYYVFKLYAYIHSGVKLSLTHNGDRFDTSMRGYVLVNEEHSGTVIEAEKLANGWVNIWNYYLQDDVYQVSFYYKNKWRKMYVDPDNEDEHGFDEKYFYSTEYYYGDNFDENGLNDAINELKNTYRLGKPIKVTET